MNLFVFIGFSPDTLHHVQYKKRTRIFLEGLSQSFIVLWLFLVLSCFFFTSMATHNGLVALMSAALFGFIQWNIILLINSSIRLSPLEYAVFVEQHRRYEYQLKRWEALPIQERESTPKPKPLVMPLPSFVNPTVFFVTLSTLGGIVWSMFWTTSYINIGPSPDKVVTIHEIITRAELTFNSGWMSVGTIFGLCIGLLPSIIRVINKDTIHSMFQDLAQMEYTQVLLEYQKHRHLLYNRFHKGLVEHFDSCDRAADIFLSDSTYADPPFNQQPKIMGRIKRDNVFTLEIPPEPEDAEIEEDVATEDTKTLQTSED